MKRGRDSDRRDQGYVNPGEGEKGEKQSKRNKGVRTRVP